jgi:2-amino-4-hydroxy-6-hydroxymethyldihydropteridine diphosphokinase
MEDVIAHIGLGSNLGDRPAWLRAGIDGLCAAGLELTAVSSVWESEPVDAPTPSWFLNMVVAARTKLRPLELLDVLLDIEHRCGRVRTVPNAARTLDLDLLRLGDRRWRDGRLELPHPRMWERRFVLEPLREIAPDLRNPDSGRSVAEECERARHRSVAFEVGRLRLAGIIRPSTGPWRSAAGHEIQIDRR